MTLDLQLRELDSIIHRHFASTGYDVRERQSLPGIGTYITIETSGIWVRATAEHDAYVVEVATPRQPEEWHHLPEVLLLLTGEAYAPEKVRVGKNPDDLDRFCRLLSEQLSAVVDLFSVDRLPNTVERLTTIRQQAVRPLFELAKNRPAS